VVCATNDAILSIPGTGLRFEPTALSGCVGVFSYETPLKHFDVDADLGAFVVQSTTFNADAEVQWSAPIEIRSRRRVCLLKRRTVPPMMCFSSRTQAARVE
jgi:hypothetical protein